MSETKVELDDRSHRALDESTIERVRQRIGIPVHYSRRLHNEVSSSDSFRHFAESCGDDNPLYVDPEYARASSWGSSIAPPVYLVSAGVQRPVEWSAEQKAAMSGGDPLAGIGQYMCGERWLFVRPVRAGDLLSRSMGLHAAVLKTSKFGGGTGALVSHQVRWEDEAGAPAAFRFLDFWHAERESSRETAKYRSLEPGRYTAEDIDRIDALYAAEAVRGPVPRLAADVQPGEDLGTIVKGPLCVSEIISHHSGFGMGQYGTGASKLSYRNRRRVPKFYVKNEAGFWDVVQRCHWEDSWAEKLGQPMPYDYGVMRTCWMAHLISNWMGDDAWIWKLSSSVRRFNYLGDVHYISGRVGAVNLADNTVDVQVNGVNQRGQTTCMAEATVILPPPGGGHAALREYRPEDVPEAKGP